jgi:SAM-dependent methyltransferase
LRQGDQIIACSNCDRQFPVVLDIIDFHDADKDKTASLSVGKDRLIAKRLTELFGAARTFNELHDVYWELFNRYDEGADIEAFDVTRHLNRDGAPSLMTAEQLSHGRAILEKMPLYLAPTGRELPVDGVALENGCSLGLWVDGLAATFRTLIVLDFSLSYLLLVRKIVEERSLSNVYLICGNAERLPLRTGCIDFVHSNNVIEHVSDQRAMVSESERVLTEEGMLFIMSPNRFSAYIEPHFELYGYGFIPEFIRRAHVRRKQNRDISEVSLLSLGELRAIIATFFPDRFQLSFIPRTLRETATGGAIRTGIVKALNSRIGGGAANLLMNRMLLGIMPYHVAFCFKRQEAGRAQVGTTVAPTAGPAAV